MVDTASYEQLLNFSGCGNTVNANHPVTLDLIVDSIKHWVKEYHVDGFRFDLASCLCRGAQYCASRTWVLYNNVDVISNVPHVSAHHTYFCTGMAVFWVLNLLLQLGDALFTSIPCVVFKYLCFCYVSIGATDICQ